jgi:hypothetical protein
MQEWSGSFYLDPRLLSVSIVDRGGGLFFLIFQDFGCFGRLAEICRQRT